MRNAAGTGINAGAGGGAGAVLTPRDVAEAQLRRLEQDRDRLAAELQTLQDAIPTKTACEELVRAVEAAPEPFSESAPRDKNPWITSQDQRICCCIM